MGRRIARALLLALLVPACTGGPWIPRSRLAGWHAAEAGGVRLVGDLAPDEVRELAGALARFDAIFARLVGWAPGTGATPLSVYCVRSREIAERFGLGRGLAGFALGTLDESFIAVAISSGRDEDRNTLFHEYTHVLLARNRRAPLPRWYHEGLATYFSTVHERHGAVIVGAADGTLVARVAHGGALPLDRLFSDSLREATFEEVAAFYATSWALSHYLLSSPGGRRELSEFVKQLERGVPVDEAQRSAFGRSTDRLGRELAVHAGRLARGASVEAVIDATGLAEVEPPPVVALDPGEAAAALGALALAMVEVDEAREWERGPALAGNLLSLAAAEATSDPRVEAALGEARAVAGDSEAALADVREAVRRAPHDPRVRLHAGRVALLRAEAEQGGTHEASSALVEAEQQYRHALALAPDSSSAWFGIGRTLVRMGRSEEAFAAFATARQLGWSEPLDVALARLHLERGERERAAALLRPIAADPHGGPMQQEAARLLEQTQP